jgi:cytochrome b involved in lipid metabolism
MTSYILNWFLAAPSPQVDEPPSDSIPSVPTLIETSPPPSDDDGEETEKEDDDRPPMFPSLASAQRVSTPSLGLPRVLTDSELMPPPPAPHLATRQPGTTSLTVSNSSSLAVPATTRPPSNASNKKSRKVALAPGHSPLDWANLKSSGKDLRVRTVSQTITLILPPLKGVDSLLRIPPSVLKTHNKLDDAWSAINGKVYNITPYLPYHPGGEKELMRAAGRDGTKLFSEIFL